MNDKVYKHGRIDYWRYAGAWRVQEYLGGNLYRAYNVTKEELNAIKAKIRK